MLEIEHHKIHAYTHEENSIPYQRASEQRDNALEISYIFVFFSEKGVWSTITIFKVAH